MEKLTSFRRLGVAASALVAAGALSLAGCTASNTPGSTPTAGGANTPAASGCGSVPQVAPKDPDGLLASLDPDLQAGYNAYGDPIQKTSLATFKSSKTSGFTAAIVGTAPAAPFIANYEKALDDSLKANGVNVVLNVAPNDPSDVPGQLQMFGQAVSLKPDIIFFMPVAPQPAVDLIKQAHDAGIVVVSLITSVDSPDTVNITYNQPLQALETTAAVAQSIGGKGSVLEVTGVPGIPNEQWWEDGVNQALALCPDISIAGQVQGLFQPPLAQQAVTQFLATNPAGVDAVLQAGTMGWAIRDAFTQAGLPVPPIQDVGASQGMAAYAAANPSYAYVGTSTPPVDMAKQAAQVGLKILAGAGPKLNQIVFHPYIVNSSNLASVVDKSWSQADGTDLSVKGVYFTDAQTAQFFTNPELGPQSTK